jgi:Protein of unknown function (DUF2510)
MISAAGWYPDPSGSGQHRYFDGRSWTSHTQAHVLGWQPPPGWYTDPDDGQLLRFWDGELWTERRARELPASGTVRVDPPVESVRTAQAPNNVSAASAIVWDRGEMERRGFRGFVRFNDLPLSDVPPLPGVYCVVRPSDEPPEFLASSPAGHFKGIDPTVSVIDLESNWVSGARVVYLGKAGAGASGTRGLRKRLDEFRAFGAGRPVGHQGGKRIWQLTDSAELLVGWMTTADGVAKDVERRLLAEFRVRYGQLPFANMR